MPVKKTGDDATSTAKMVAADVDPGIAVNRRENAERQGDQQREQKRKPGQLRRQWQALDDQRGDLGPLAVGAAEVAAAANHPPTSGTASAEADPAGIAARILARFCSLMRCPPTMIRAGSPGTNRTMKKTIEVMRNISGMSVTSRVRISRAISDVHCSGLRRASSRRCCGHAHGGIDASEEAE